jgi:hypothetical protein
MKLTKGDVFSIETKKGLGFLQYLETSIFKIDYIRVLDFISESGNITQEEINQPERWCIEFPLKVAIRRKLVEKVDNFLLPESFIIPKYSRTKHIIKGEFKGWFIVNRNSWKLTFVEKLNDNQMQLSPSGIMNDTLIKERLESDWKLSKWV